MVEATLGTVDERRYTQWDEPRAVQMAIITSEQIRAARGLLRWEQKNLAAECGLSTETIKSIERRRGPIMVRTSSLYALQAAFDRAGVEFFDAGTTGGAGVRWKSRK